MTRVLYASNGEKIRKIMNTLRREKNGIWKAEARKNHQYISITFDSKGDASKCERQVEIRIRTRETKQ